MLLYTANNEVMDMYFLVIWSRLLRAASETVLDTLESFKLLTSCSQGIQFHS